ncbi:MAG: DoxX family protein [Deinococcota bacterium]
MNILLWILQALLALLFGVSGFMKATSSKEALKERAGERMVWVDSLSEGNLKIVGILEVLAAIGLILPLATGILPWLTPLAAVGLVLTMVGAIILHVQRNDGAQSIITNVVLLAVAAFVAYGRFI